MLPSLRPSAPGQPPPPPGRAREAGQEAPCGGKCLTSRLVSEADPKVPLAASWWMLQCYFVLTHTAPVQTAAFTYSAYVKRCRRESIPGRDNIWPTG